MRRISIIVVVCCLAVGGFLLAMTGSATAQEEVTIDVTVLDQEGEEVGNANLLVSVDGEEREVSTTSGGVAVFDVPKGSDIKIDVEHPVYAQNFPYTINNASVPAGQSRLDANIVVSRAATTDITVVEQGAPIEQARLRIADPQHNERVRVVPAEEADTYTVETGANSSSIFQTGEDGTLTIEGLERRDSPYQVRIEKAGYLDNETEITVETSDATATLPIQSDDVRANFSVKDDSFDPSQPVADARIEIVDRGESVTTNDDGTRRTLLPVNNQYDIRVTKDGYEEATATITVEEEPVSRDLFIRRTPALNLAVPVDQVVLNQTVPITVTDAYDEPVEEAPVFLADEEVAQTDENGETRIQIQQEGNQTIRVENGDLEVTSVVQGVRGATDDDQENNETDGQDMDNETDEQSNETDEQDADDDGAGFGIVAAATAVLAVALVLRRR